MGYTLYYVFEACCCKATGLWIWGRGKDLQSCTISLQDESYSLVLILICLLFCHHPQRCCVTLFQSSPLGMWNQNYFQWTQLKHKPTDLNSTETHRSQCPKETVFHLPSQNTLSCLLPSLSGCLPEVLTCATLETALPCPSMAFPREGANMHKGTCAGPARSLCRALGFLSAWSNLIVRQNMIIRYIIQ